MRVPRQPTREIDAVAMTSMIDIVFLLLIFFIVSASGQVREWLMPTELSAAGAVEAVVTPPVEELPTVEVWLKLTVSDSGATVVDVNGTLYADWQKLKSQLLALAELGPENPIILDIAQDVPLKDIVDIHDTCQAAGYLSISFAADAV